MSINPYLSTTEKKLLSAAVIGIAGAGGLGSNVAALLVRAGIKNFVIADDDVVNPTNLNRQFFFAADCGQLKVAALRKNLLAITPELALTMHNVRVTRNNAAAIFQHCQIVLECFDDVAAKKMLLAVMSETAKTVIAASGIGGWGRSNELTVKKITARLYLIGDGETAVDNTKIFPQAPRVALAAALQANTALAVLLGQPI